MNPCEDCRCSCEVPCWKVDHGLLQPAEWISVKDRLPETSGRYLLLSVSGQIFDGEYDSCIDGVSPFGDWRSYYHPDTLGYLDSEWEPFDGITHWMPLPEPPREDTP